MALSRSVFFIFRYHFSGEWGFWFGVVQEVGGYEGYLFSRAILMSFKTHFWNSDLDFVDMDFDGMGLKAQW